jgi:hypothetical protein
MHWVEEQVQVVWVIAEVPVELPVVHVLVG